jgi:hypothetical protein
MDVLVMHRQDKDEGRHNSSILQKCTKTEEAPLPIHHDITQAANGISKISIFQYKMHYVNCLYK